MNNNIKMYPLTNDEWSYIMGFVEKNNDKCNLLKVCKRMSNCKFYFYGPVDLTTMNGSIWYDKFINVIVDDLVTLPLHIKSLTFGWNFNEPINNYIPFGVTHLKFGNWFNQPINNCIPPSVTHLTFGSHFNQPIKDCIPSSVTHLTFDVCFDQSIKDSIPSSVKYYEFKKRYDYLIENPNIPFFRIKKNEK